VSALFPNVVTLFGILLLCFLFREVFGITYKSHFNIILALFVLALARLQLVASKAPVLSKYPPFALNACPEVRVASEVGNDNRQSRLEGFLRF